MNLGILCSGNLGFLNLCKLAKLYSIDFVFTDSKSFPIIDFCKCRNIPLFVGNPRDGRGKTFLKNRCRYLISINYIFIVESDIIDMADKLAFNIHGSLLPKYRGRTPHVWAIINDETVTGITAHVMEKGCDTGDILLQQKVYILPEDTGYDILKKYENLYFPLIKEVINQSENNILTKEKQNETLATYFGKRTPSDGEVCWDWSRRRIKNWIRAQSNPYPGAFTYIGEKKIIVDKVIESDLGFNQNEPNGLIKADTPNVIVKTPNGCLELLEIRGNKFLCKKGLVFNSSHNTLYGK